MRSKASPPPMAGRARALLHPLHPPRAEETESFRALVKAAFAQRRKTLRNAWSGVYGGDKQRLEAAASHAGIVLDARGETLSVEDFDRMSRELC
jgi:16S rRNA (adenine1518-N6/adenine1519-N6)-dimethyltransferase